MKILKLFSRRDLPSRYNYHVKYGVWDAIHGDIVFIDRLDFKILDNYDVVFLPENKRWAKHKRLFEKIKEHGIKSVLFDNDSCYRLFESSLYQGVDFIFYRDLDSKGRAPHNGAFLKWSIDTDLYLPKFGGSGVLFNCMVDSNYPLRVGISKFMPTISLKGEEYIKAIQDSAAAIHTDSPTLPAVRAKVLEFAACGTQIISNRTRNMELYFPHELITYFDSLDELRSIVGDFSPDIETQKQLRQITEKEHSTKVRARWILETLQEKL